MERSRSSRPPPALVSVFERFLSPINARALARSVTHRAGAGGSPATLLRHIEATSVFFVPIDKREALIEAARQLLGPEIPATAPVGGLERISISGVAVPNTSALSAAGTDVLGPTVAIRMEADLNEARLVARQMCQQVGLQGFAAQKFVTAVSELARNVAKYACPGRVAFSHDAVGRRLRVVVSDRGTGIPNLDAVLDGKYRSKTGMGLGLVGTRKLVDEFDAQTGATGTTIAIAVKY